jgi:hypothetical protein
MTPAGSSVHDDGSIAFAASSPTQGDGAGEAAKPHTLPSVDAARGLTTASGARTTSAPSGLKMSSPPTRSASEDSLSSSSAESRKATRQPGPKRPATASAT